MLLPGTVRKPSGGRRAGVGEGRLQRWGVSMLPCKETRVGAMELQHHVAWPEFWGKAIHFMGGKSHVFKVGN